MHQNHLLALSSNIYVQGYLAWVAVHIFLAGFLQFKLLLNNKKSIIHQLCLIVYLCLEHPRLQNLKNSFFQYGLPSQWITHNILPIKLTHSCFNYYFLVLLWQDWPPKFDTFDKIFYFWIFFVLANGLWIFAPVTIMLQTLLEMKDVYNPANSSGKKCN